MLFPFFCNLWNRRELPLGKNQSIASIVYPKTAKNRGTKKCLIFSLHWSTPTPHRSMPVLPQLPVSRPCRRRERGRERGRGGQRRDTPTLLSQVGTTTPRPWYKPSSTIVTSFQIQCDLILKSFELLTITWCKSKPLSKHKAKLHLHLRLQMSCLTRHQIHESDLFSHLTRVISV